MSRTQAAVTIEQVSAGGVVFRRRSGRTEIALISAGDEPRWQLPKGLVDEEETLEEAAWREVREETGLEVELIAPIDVIEYWYFSQGGAARVRFHKFVHFYLFRYKTGDVRDHDMEVNEARWVEIEAAQEMLAFKGERQIVARAREML